MPNQSNYEKIDSEIIQPMTQIWGIQLNDYSSTAMTEDLSRFDAAVLREGMKELRQTRKRAPTIADIIEACTAVMEKKSYVPTGKVVNSPAYGMEKDFSGVCQQVMASQFGQLALREGWAGSLWIETRRTGKTDWQPSDAYRFRQGLQNATEAAIELDRSENKAKNPMTMKLLSIFDAMCQRERELMNKYLVRA